MSDADVSLWPRNIEHETWDEFLMGITADGGSSLVYRGLREYQWDITTTLHRSVREQAKSGGPIDIDFYESMVAHPPMDAHVRATESSLLRAFVDASETIGIVDPPLLSDRLGWWELMQHHGVPTRLLDWTRSPFVALWFATRKADEESEAKDGAIWVLDTQICWNHYAKFRAVLDVEDDWTAPYDSRSYQNHIANLAINDREFLPMVVSPRRAVARVVAQQSVMTLAPSVSTPTGFQNAVFGGVLSKIRIRNEWREHIDQLFLSHGISRLALFPDLDSLGEELTKRLCQNRPIEMV